MGGGGEEKDGRYERYCTTVLSLMRERCVVTGKCQVVSTEQCWWPGAVVVEAAAVTMMMIIITSCQPPPRDDSAEIAAASAFGERYLISSLGLVS